MMCVSVCVCVSLGIRECLTLIPTVESKHTPSALFPFFSFSLAVEAADLLQIKFTKKKKSEFLSHCLIPSNTHGGTVLEHSAHIQLLPQTSEEIGTFALR